MPAMAPADRLDGDDELNRANDEPASLSELLVELSAASEADELAPLLDELEGGSTEVAVMTPVLPLLVLLDAPDTTAAEEEVEEAVVALALPVELETELGALGTVLPLLPPLLPLLLLLDELAAAGCELFGLWTGGKTLPSLV